MIVLSLILVIAAAVLLIAGFFQTGLTLIYASIGACVLAMVFLGIGVLQRKRSRPAPRSTGYGPGAGTTPVRPSGATRPTAVGEGETQSASVGGQDESDVVVRKTSAAEAPRKKAVKKVAGKAQEPSRAAGDGQVEDRPVEEQAATSTKSTTKATTSKKSTKRKAAKKSTTKASKRTAAKKRSTAKKATKKKAASKKSAKKTAKKTTGAEARQALAGIKGVGPAKQDALLERFGSLEAIRSASVEELSELPGIGEATARGIKDDLS